MEFEFPEDSFDGKLMSSLRLMCVESIIKKDVKQKKEALHIKTKKVIEGLSEDEALKIVEQKWIAPLIKDLEDISSATVLDVIRRMEYLARKYVTTMHDLQEEKTATRRSIVELISNLQAEGPDMEGLNEFKTILRGNS